ncbi:MAG TPA: YraN family protein [Opitutaceae bacterium]|jgi:putative endonuclease|nr:YraN family protein [Opitutaceae bacterium]
MPLPAAARNENYTVRTMFSWLKTLFRHGGDSAPAGAAGAAGERAAAEFLQRERGFAIIARNWRSPRDRRDELDLVCREGEVLVFVEVKTRAAHALVPGYDAITARKKKALRRACATYLRALGAAQPRTFRFDVVEVATHAGGGPPELRHFEHVPLFPKNFV